ncbi:putative lipoprotein [Brevibacterium yomogidense]|uniref:Putative lipoprotein n=1 Tax=Brevibacterium yomogidense TaxID=946573 RepID=A0A1X6XFE7_9MICO|nr:putative lipoprotein [Brevibacterium yomogidense]
MITDNPAEAANGVVEHGESRGGYVESREERVDHDGEAAVDIALRVPADQFDKLMTDVDGSGEVVHRSQSAEDVAGAVRDLDSRIGALEVSTERLEDIMGEADTSADLLEAEAALSERQGELEELVAQREDLDDQVSMSTLRVELRSTDRADDSGGIADWFLDVWNALLNSAGGLVIVLAALLPWVVVIGIPAYLITRWLIRRSGRGSSSRRVLGAGAEDLQTTGGGAVTDAPDSYRAAAGAVDGEEDSSGMGPRS